MCLRSSDPRQRGGSCGPWSTAHPVAPGPSGSSCAAGATSGYRSESSQPAPGRQVHGAFSGSGCGSDTGPRRVSGDLRESWKERAMDRWTAGRREPAARPSHYRGRCPASCAPASSPAPEQRPRQGIHSPGRPGVSVLPPTHTSAELLALKGPPRLTAGRVPGGGVGVSQDPKPAAAA